MNRHDLVQPTSSTTETRSDDKTPGQPITSSTSSNLVQTPSNLEGPISSNSSDLYSVGRVDEVPPPARIDPLQAISEADFQRQVVELAHTFEWKVAHFRAALNRRGHWQTPVGADGAGWPDLAMVHPTAGLLFIELKAQRGRLSTDQQAWGEALLTARADWRCWRPSDWPEIVQTLTLGRGQA